MKIKLINKNLLNINFFLFFITRFFIIKIKLSFKQF